MREERKAAVASILSSSAFTPSISGIRIKKSLPADKAKDLNWSYGMPGDRFQKALLDWQVEQINDEYYRMVNVDSDDLNMVLKALDITIPNDLFTRGQLRSIASGLNLF